MAGYQGEDKNSSTEEDWDASSEDEKEEAKPAQPKKKGKSSLAAKIAEREAKEAEAKKKQDELNDLTPAERQKKIEEDELSNAAEFIDIKDASAIDLNKWTPRSKHDYQMYTELLQSTIGTLSDSPFYVDFVCDLTREMLRPLNLDNTRKIEQVLKVQINELVKTNKNSKKGKNKKAGLNTGQGKGRGVDIENMEEFDDDFDDLM